ncbi:MAG: glycosyltransferase family protein [Gammaproteobacteria bacterium]|nr:glycosyltransferase family protein [Gammaproteobacteria bacterium]
MKTLAILQARASSTRLANKVLLPILKQPMLILQIMRITRCRNIDKLLVATSNDASDDAIAKLCAQNNIACFRGSLNDVLDRFYNAAEKYQPQHVVRLTADCPLIDHAVIDAVIEHHLNGNFDYTSNTITRSFPDGLDVEIMKISVLSDAWHEAKLPSHREHVTPFVYQHPDRYQIGQFTNNKNLANLRWTVDEPEDFNLIVKIYENLYPKKPDFNMNDIIDLLTQHPELKKINDNITCNEGMLKSLKADRQYLIEEQ